MTQLTTESYYDAVVSCTVFNKNQNLPFSYTKFLALKDIFQKCRSAIVRNIRIIHDFLTIIWHKFLETEQNIRIIQNFKLKMFELISFTVLLKSVKFLSWQWGFSFESLFKHEKTLSHLLALYP